MAPLVQLLNLMVTLTISSYCIMLGALAASPVEASTEVVAAVCRDSGLTCGVPRYSSIRAPLRDYTIHTVNDLQKDFFVEAALVLGGEMNLDTNLYDPIPAKAFLTAADAAKVPELKLSNVPRILAHFGVATNSEMATAIGTSAYMCGNPALPGEARSCPLSLEAMGSFVKAQLGTNEVEVMGTSHTPKTAPASKAPVTIVGVKKGSLAQGKRIVVCHHIALPAMAYYCHSVTGTKVVKVDLKDAAGAIIKGVCICHMDTSMWLSSHPAFAALHIPKGDTACHALVENDLVFAPASKCADAIAE